MQLLSPQGASYGAHPNSLSAAWQQHDNQMPPKLPSQRRDPEPPSSVCSPDPGGSSLPTQLGTVPCNGKAPQPFLRPSQELPPPRALVLPFHQTLLGFTVSQLNALELLSDHEFASYPYRHSNLHWCSSSLKPLV